MPTAGPAEVPEPNDSTSPRSKGLSDFPVAQDASGGPEDVTPLRTAEEGVAVGELALLRAEVSALATDMRRYCDLIDRLHSHNEELRRGPFERMTEPIFRDLIKLLEDYRRLGLSWAARESAAPADVGQVFVDIAEDIDMLLERYGVEQVSPEPGTPFDRREHRAIATTPTTDAVQDATVQSTRSPGYRVGNRILRFPEVVVHHMVLPNSQAPDQTPAGSVD
jgi:molecular chaperone GrpE (heat shock protein)